MSKLVFRAEDFELMIPKVGENDESHAAARIAQTILENWLMDQPVVYGKWDEEYKQVHGLFGQITHQDMTHQARLVCIEEIKCEHVNVEERGLRVVVGPEAGKVFKVNYYCEACGIQMNPVKFEAVDDRHQT